MPNEEDAQRKAVEQAAATKAAAEEERKRLDRASVTKGLTDAKTMMQLSSSGIEAQKRRGKK